MMALGLAGSLKAQQNQFPYDSYKEESGITTIHAQGGVYMLQGTGGNVVVQIGDMGVVVVDRTRPKRRQADCCDSQAFQ